LDLIFFSKNNLAHVKLGAGRGLINKERGKGFKIWNFKKQSFTANELDEHFGWVNK